MPYTVAGVAPEKFGDGGGVFGPDRRRTDGGWTAAAADHGVNGAEIQIITDINAAPLAIRVL